MLDDNPVLKERLMACGAFGGIALFAVASVNVMISGGFDFGPARADYDRAPQHSAYVRVVDAAHYVGDQFRSISFDEASVVAEAAASEPLAGADEGPVPADEVNAGDDLYQQIASLYEYGATEATIEAEAAVYDEQPDAEAEKPVSTYENALSW